MGCYPAVRDALCGMQAGDSPAARAARKSAGPMFLSGLLSGGLGYGGLGCSPDTPIWGGDWGANMQVTKKHRTTAVFGRLSQCLAPLSHALGDTAGNH